MTRLIIAEKPAMGKEIAKALKGPYANGQGYIKTAEGIVTWCVGHIMRSLNPDEYMEEWKAWNMNMLPMIPSEWKITVDKTKSAQFKVIKELLKECDEVVNAGDPGREGQLIIDEVLDYLKNKKPVKRVLLYALDPKSVREAFDNLRPNKEFYSLYQAGVCRGYADWLMGMNASRAYTLKAQQTGYRGVLSVGRVQSPTLAIVVKRDLEIENFVPKDYFTITAEFDKSGSAFKANWKPIFDENDRPAYLDEESRLISKEKAQEIVSKISGKTGSIKSYEEKEGKEQAPLPFNLSKLQIYASAKWGMSAKTVLDTCQSLYEEHKVQSYPRTDCQYLPENLFDHASDVLQTIASGMPDLANAAENANTKLKSPAWNDKKLSEHYGLIPTGNKINFSALNENEKKIFTAVCKAYIAQFYPACEYKTATVEVLCEEELFRASGKTITKAGWKEVYETAKEDDEQEDSDNEEQIFPNLAQGDKVNCANVDLKDKKTTPPPRYTEGSLIKAMTNVHQLVDDPEMKKKLKEKKGIGQEATRTQIIENLLKRQLIVNKGKQVISSDAGRALVKALPQKVIDPALTAAWEDLLDKIAEGALSDTEFIEKQNKWVKMLVDEAKKTSIDKIEQQPSKSSKSGGSKINVGKKASSGSSSTGSKKPSAAKKPASSSKASGSGERKSHGPCPKCKTGTLFENVTKTGKHVISCSNWNKEPKCDYAKWL